jgi:hypothetical protein
VIRCASGKFNRLRERRADAHRVHKKRHNEKNRIAATVNATASDRRAAPGKLIRNSSKRTTNRTMSKLNKTPFSILTALRMTEQN